MSFERNLVHDITYWAPTSTEDVFGAKVYATPAVLKGRWEDKIELFRDKTGEEVISKARAFFKQEIDIDGYLYLGTSVATNPRSVVGAREIRAVGRTSNLRNLESITVVHL